MITLYKKTSVLDQLTAFQRKYSYVFVIKLIRESYFCSILLPLILLPNKTKKTAVVSLSESPQKLTQTKIRL